MWNFLIWFTCGLGSANIERFFNESCDVDSIDQGEDCIEDCQGELYGCLVVCFFNNDSRCVRDCTYMNEDCHNRCPCHLLCQEGCPCEEYECKSCQEVHAGEIIRCSTGCNVELNQCNAQCDMLDIDCRNVCLNLDYRNCVADCPCANLTLPETTTAPETTSVMETTTVSETEFDDIMYDVSPEFLTQLGFNEYFSALAGEGPISIQPPPNSKDIFMGCGHIDNSLLKMGIIVKTDELFDQQSFPHGEDTEAKKVKNFHTYYDNGAADPIGFSGTPLINLNNADVYDYDDTTKLTVHTSYYSNSLWRCGAVSDKPADFKTTYKLVLYNRV